VRCTSSRPLCANSRHDKCLIEQLRRDNSVALRFRGHADQVSASNDIRLVPKISAANYRQK
jgi:hypothetical protein